MTSTVCLQQHWTLRCGMTQTHRGGCSGMSNMDKTGSIRLRAIEPEDLSLLKQWRNELKDFYREYRFINQPHQERWYETTIGDVRYVYYAIDVWDGKWCLVGSCGWCWIDWLNRHCDLSIYIGDFEWRNKGCLLYTSPSPRDRS